MAGNPTRTAFTNRTIDAALAATGDHVAWTRDVPNGFVATVFPDRIGRDGTLNPEQRGKLLVTPAKESDNGRGQVFFDVYCHDLDGIEIGISLKVSNWKGDSRPPRNSILSGSKAEHLFGLILAAKRGVVLPVLQYWQDAGGQWWRCCFNAATLLNGNDVNFTDGWTDLLAPEIGLPNIAAIEQRDRLVSILGYAPEIMPKNQGGAVAVSPLKRGGGKYCYLNAKASHHASGHAWVAVDAPAMPESYGELLDWMGEAGPMIG